MAGVATLRIRTEKRKSGKEWRVDYFICSNQNSNRGHCNNKQIRADFIEEQVKKELKKEIEKINYSKDELISIAKNSKIKMQEELNVLEKEVEKNKKKIEIIDNVLEELYKDKVNKIITQDDFQNFYNKKNEEKTKIINKINNLEYAIEKQKSEVEDVNISKILKSAKEVLDLKNITREMYEKFIEKIEFDKEKNIFIKFSFFKE